MTAPNHAMVLGASGFIGRYLCNYLGSKGWRVDRVVRSSTIDGVGVTDTGQTERTIRIGSSDNGVAQAVAVSNPEVVFNLAAAGVGAEIAYSRLVDGNAGVVARLLESLDPARTTTVVHAGSWSQYLIEDASRDVEETDRMEPTTVYGAAKAGSEIVGHAIGDRIGIDFVVLRLFNVYGPGEKPSRLIPHVVRAVLAGTVADLTSGQQFRDFVHVDDVAAAFEACSVLDRPAQRAFNVSTGVATRVCDVAEMAAREAGGDTTNLRFGAIEQRLGEPSRAVGDASALTFATGWKPRIPVAAGVRDTVRWLVGDATNPR